MNRILLLPTLACGLAAIPLLAMSFAAQSNIDGFAARNYTSDGETMPYRLFIPKAYDKQKAYPIVIWLHGAGSAGDDNLKQIGLDNRLGSHIWTLASNQAKHPAFVLVPQSTGAWEEENLVLVLGILRTLRTEFSVDSKRIYVAGQSNGGVGAWTLIISQPELFAAAVSLCGGGDPSLAKRAARVPIWAFHGAQDDVISPVHDREMIAEVRKAGGNPRYTEYPDLGHDIWERVFKEPDLVEWLFAQHK